MRGPFMVMVDWIEDGEVEAEPVFVAVTPDTVALDLPGDLQAFIDRDELLAALQPESKRSAA